MLKNIHLRIMISEIFEKNKKHILDGFTKQEKYDFYIENFWNNETYRCSLKTKYEEWGRLEKLRERYFISLKNEIKKKIN